MNALRRLHGILAGAALILLGSSSWMSGCSGSSEKPVAKEDPKAKEQVAAQQTPKAAETVPAKEEAPAKEGAQILPAAQVSADAPVATVNGKPIFKNEYDRALGATMQRFRQMGGMHGSVAQPNDALKREAMDQAVGFELLYQESSKHPTENLAQQVNDRYRGFQAQAPSPEAFQTALKEQGFTEESLKTMISRQLSVQHYVETQIEPKVAVTDQEVADFYKGNPDRFTIKEPLVRASHILIRAAADAKPEEKEAARKKADELRKRALAGEGFEQLAKQNSEDPSAAAGGGDLGFFSRGQMVQPFSDAAFALKPGDVSETVETQYGYHVIKVTGHKEPGLQPLEEVKSQLSEQLKERAVGEAVRAKLQELRTAAKVEVLVPNP